jgi:hypothetical protein
LCSAGVQSKDTHRDAAPLARRNPLQELKMRQSSRHARGLVAAVLVLGFAAEVHAAVPRGILAQRRGSMFRYLQKPAPVDSSPIIQPLNKAITALGSTDRDYEGHRAKAIAHVGAAIRYMEMPNAKGKSNAAIDKATSGSSNGKSGTTAQAASDEALRKAKAILFTVHHQLSDHASTKGQLHADAEVRRAIDEIVAALKTSGTASPAAADDKAASPAGNTIATKGAAGPDPFAARDGADPFASLPAQTKSSTTTSKKAAK